MGTTFGKQAANNRMSSNQYYSRRAHHAGSWYSSDPNELDTTLTDFMEKVENQSNNAPPLRGIICPHAGYSYSGPTAAYSYWHLQQQIQNRNTQENGEMIIQHILVLHPSHHVYLDGCAVSGATHLETPVGNLVVDEELRREILQKSALFTVMSQDVDEREHSGEMQYPYIAKALQGKLDQIKVLPIMCGALSPPQEEKFGKLLAPIVARPDVLCVISTDFCHWGKRFQYQPTPTPTSVSSQQIFEYIRELDHRGMDLIELQQPGAFAKYLKETHNTICGRHAIGVWLNAVHANHQSSAESLEIQFVRYAQSSEVRSMRESSVSYASATARRKL